MIDAASTIKHQMQQMAELERERNALVLELAEMKSQAAHYQADKTRILRILKDARKSRASESFLRHSLTRIEQVMTEIRRVA